MRKYAIVINKLQDVGGHERTLSDFFEI